MGIFRVTAACAVLAACAPNTVAPHTTSAASCMKPDEAPDALFTRLSSIESDDLPACITALSRYAIGLAQQDQLDLARTYFLIVQRAAELKIAREVLPVPADWKMTPYSSVVEDGLPAAIEISNKLIKVPSGGFIELNLRYGPAKRHPGRGNAPIAKYAFGRHVGTTYGEMGDVSALNIPLNDKLDVEISDFSGADSAQLAEWARALDFERIADRVDSILAKEADDAPLSFGRLSYAIRADLSAQEPAPTGDVTDANLADRKSKIGLSIASHVLARDKGRYLTVARTANAASWAIDAYLRSHIYACLPKTPIWDSSFSAPKPMMIDEGASSSGRHYGDDMGDTLWVPTIDVRRGYALHGRKFEIHARATEGDRTRRSDEGSLPGAASPDDAGMFHFGQWLDLWLSGLDDKYAASLVSQIDMKCLAQLTQYFDAAADAKMRAPAAAPADR